MHPDLLAFTEADIYKILSTLDLTKSSSPNSIWPTCMVLKDCAVALAPPLYHLYITSIKPVSWSSHIHSPYCLILQPNLPQCLSCCLTCFGPPGAWVWFLKIIFFQRYIVPINRVGGWGAGRRASEAGNTYDRLTRCGKEERL